MQRWLIGYLSFLCVGIAYLATVPFNGADFYVPSAFGAAVIVLVGIIVALSACLIAAKR